MPVQFISSENTQSFIPAEVPGFCQPLLVARAEPFFFKGHSCSYLLQKITGTYLKLHTYSFFVSNKTKIYAVAHEPLLTLIFILGGNNTSNFNGTGPVEYKEGYCYLFYISPSQQHEINFSEGDYKLVSVHLTSLLATHFFEKITPLNELVEQVRQSSKTSRMYGAVPFPLSAIGILQTILESTEENEAWDIYLLSKITELLFLYYKETEAPSKTHIKGLKRKYDLSYLEKVISAKQAIDKHKGKPLSLTEVMQKSVLNEKDLKSGFKAIFGTSVYAYQMERRLENGRRLLMDTSLSIEIIAKEVGYEDPPSFANEFKKYFGMPPSKYRQNIG